MRTLLLWLEAPLQSWGASSRYGRRDTLPFPTRSGILGLLCCAMGKGGEQREWLEAIKDQTQTVVAFARKGKDDKPIRQPLLQDFHMVGSGYDANDKWQDMLIPKKADGKRPTNSTGSKLTYRYYLQDMAFACALALPDSMQEEEIAAALAAPVWSICLGRKNCVPSDIVYRGFFDTEEEALAHAAALAKEKKRMPIFTVLQGNHEEGDVLCINDVPVCFGLHKRYEDRTVTVVMHQETTQGDDADESTMKESSLL